MFVNEGKGKLTSVRTSTSFLSTYLQAPLFPGAIVDGLSDDRPPCVDVRQVTPVDRGCRAQRQLKQCHMFNTSATVLTITDIHVYSESNDFHPIVKYSAKCLTIADVYSEVSNVSSHHQISPKKIPCSTFFECCNITQEALIYWVEADKLENPESMKQEVQGVS